MAGAKQIRDEIMRLTIVVNSDPAQREIHNLNKANDSYAKSIEELKQKKKELGRVTDSNRDEFKKLNAEIQKNQSSIDSNRKKITDLTGALDINQMTMSQLRKEAQLLRAQLAHVIPGTKPAKDLQTQLDLVTGRMNEVRTGARTTAMSFSNLAERFNHYSGLVAAGLAIFAGFALSLQQVVDRNNKMADAMSGVEKTTGMARAEVEQLTRSFSDFDTRTKKIDLLKIAEVGGRLGVAKQDIAAFTQEVDKAGVALGDGWEGGVAKMTDTLGRVINLFAETRDQPIVLSINEIGSALNELAAQGASSEQNIADFLLRTGNMPGAMKPPLNTLLGFGSAFEEMGVNSEIASSGFSKFIRVAANNIDGFAKVMNRSVADVKALINSNPAEFFLQFSEGLKGLEGDQVAKILDSLKLADNEVQKAIGAATENSDLFRRSVDLASKSVAEATSLQDEFNKVNNNAAAIWEKVQRKIAEVFTSQYVARFLESSINAFALFIGVNDTAEKSMGAFGRTVLTVVRVAAILTVGIFSITAAISAYNLLLKESIARTIALEAIQKLQTTTLALQNATRAIWNGLVGAGQLMLGRLTHAVGANIGAVGLQTKALDMSAAAQTRLNLAMRANPIGVIITLLGLAVTAYMSYKAIVGDTESSQRKLNDVMMEGTQAAGAEIAQLEILYKRATNVRLSMEERLKAVKDLKAQFPGYFGQINDEIILNGKATRSYHELRAAIVASARAKAAQAELEKREGERLGDREKFRSEYTDEVLKLRRLKEEMKELEAMGRLNGNRRLEMVTRIAGQEKHMQKLITDGIAKKKQEQKDDKVYLDEIDKSLKNAERLGPTPGTAATPYTVPDPDAGKSDKDAERLRKQQERDAKRNAKDQERHDKRMETERQRGDQAAELARQIQLEIEDARVEAMEDGYLKQIEIINQQEQRKLFEIDKKKISQNEFDALDAKIAKATGDDKLFFESLKRSWIQNNQDLESLKASQREVYDLKRQEAEHKYFADDIKKQEANLQEKLALITRAKNEQLVALQTVEEQKAFLRDKTSADEIAQIRTIEEGKAAIERYYQREAMKRQVEFLQGKLAEFEALKQLDIPLDPAQMAVIEDYRNKIAELVAEIDRLKGNGTVDTKGNAEAGKKSFEDRGTARDLLGLTPDEWEAMFTQTDNLAQAIGKVSAAIGIAQQMFAAYFQFVEANEKRQLQNFQKTSDSKKKKLQMELDSGRINQETFKKETIKIDEELEKKKAELAVKRAKRERVMKIAEVITNTSVAIMQAYAQLGPIAGTVAAVLIGTLGAVQLGTIMRTPLPTAEGYESGFNTDQEYPITRSQDGRTFRARRRKLQSGPVDRPTHFIAGEGNKLEMVIDHPTWTSYPPELKQAIHSANARANGYESGYNVRPEAQPVSSGSDAVTIELLQVLHEYKDVMQDIRRFGIKAVIEKSARTGKDIEETRGLFRDIDDKNKH